MTKGLVRSLSRARPLEARIIKQTVIMRDAAMTVDGASGVGFGTLVAEGLPEGNILFLGAIANVTFAGSGSDAGLVDTWVGDFGVGTTPASDGTITNDDVNLIESTALAAATAEVSPTTRGETASAGTSVIINNTAGDLEVNLNLLIDDASISADGVAITVRGEIFLSYVMLGDD